MYLSSHFTKSLAIFWYTQLLHSKILMTSYMWIGKYLGSSCMGTSRIKTKYKQFFILLTLVQWHHMNILSMHIWDSSVPLHHPVRMTPCRYDQLNATDANMEKMLLSCDVTAEVIDFISIVIIVHTVSVNYYVTMRCSQPSVGEWSTSHYWAMIVAHGEIATWSSGVRPVC